MSSREVQLNLLAFCKKRSTLRGSQDQQRGSCCTISSQQLVQGALGAALNVHRAYCCLTSLHNLLELGSQHQHCDCSKVQPNTSHNKQMKVLMESPGLCCLARPSEGIAEGSDAVAQAAQCQ